MHFNGAGGGRTGGGDGGFWRARDYCGYEERMGGWDCRLEATPLMELMIAAGKVVLVLQLEHGLAVDRVYTGSFMTSLYMAVMKADQKILNRLDAPTRAPNWPVGADGRPPSKIPVLSQSRPTKNDEPLSRPQQLSPQGYILEMDIESTTTAFINLKDNLNEWVSKVCDGDFGSTDMSQKPPWQKLVASDFHGNQLNISHIFRERSMVNLLMVLGINLLIALEMSKQANVPVDESRKKI